VSWAIWAVLLILQNASHTWTSRARNTSRIAENAVASVCSNGVWIISLALVVNKVTEGVSLWVVGPFYVVFTVIGSVGMHWLLLKRGH
jgi:hypothetical protein